MHYYLQTHFILIKYQESKMNRTLKDERCYYLHFDVKISNNIVVNE